MLEGLAEDADVKRPAREGLSNAEKAAATGRAFPPAKGRAKKATPPAEGWRRWR